MLIEHPCIYLAEIDRQHVAEIFALQALCLAQMQGIDLGHARLGAIAAEAIATQSPEQVQAYAAMSWEEAIGEITRSLYAYIHQHAPQTVCLPQPRGPLQ